MLSKMRTVLLNLKILKIIDTKTINNQYYGTIDYLNS